jgi:YHS domain-containing protein
MRSFSFRALCVVLLVAGLAWASHAGVASATQEKVKDPVCGMNVDPGTAKYSTTYNGVKYYFCSEDCLNKFKAEPAKYVKGTSEATKVKDPVCGMSIDPSKAKYSTTYNDKKYYFCSEDCLNTFKAEPTKYVK